MLTGKAKWWDFVPYALCVKKCPAKFSIVDTTTYGGCEYVGAEAGSGAACDPTNTPTFYAAFETKQMLSRCFPVLETAPGKQRTLCAVPKCDSTAAEGEEQACISVDGAPDAGNGAPSGATRLAWPAGPFLCVVAPCLTGAPGHAWHCIYICVALASALAGGPACALLRGARLCQ